MPLYICLKCRMKNISSCLAKFCPIRIWTLIRPSRSRVTNTMQPQTFFITIISAIIKSREKQIQWSSYPRLKTTRIVTRQKRTLRNYMFQVTERLIYEKKKTHCFHILQIRRKITKTKSRHKYKCTLTNMSRNGQFVAPNR